MIKQLGIKLAFTAGANRRAVAELVLAFALMALRFLPEVYQGLQQHKWLQKKGRQLSNRRVGIIGYGAIGQEVARLLEPFDCHVVVQEATAAEDGHRFIGRELLLRTADIITLHVPLTAETHYLIDAKELAMLKPDAVLINTARGGLVNETALFQHLKNFPLATAAFDVFEQEPDISSALITLPNFFCTPHIGGSTEEAIVAMGKAAIAGLTNAVECD